MGRAVEAGVGWASPNSLRGSGAQGPWAVWYLALEDYSRRLVAWEGQNPIKEVVEVQVLDGFVCRGRAPVAGYL